MGNSTKDFVEKSAAIFGDSKKLAHTYKEKRGSILVEGDHGDPKQIIANPTVVKGCLFCGPNKISAEAVSKLNVDIENHKPLAGYTICTECAEKYGIGPKLEGKLLQRTLEQIGVKFIGRDETRKDPKIDQTKVKMDTPPKNQGFKDETKDSVDRNPVKMDSPGGTPPNADEKDTKGVGSMKHGEGGAYVKYMDKGGAWREFEIPDAIVSSLQRMAESVPGPDAIKDTEQKDSPTVDKTKVKMDTPGKNVGEAGAKVPAGPDDAKAKKSMGAKYEKLLDKGGKWREKPASLDAHSPTTEEKALAALANWKNIKGSELYNELPEDMQAALDEAAENFEKKNTSDQADTKDSVDRKGPMGNITVGKDNVSKKEVPSGPEVNKQPDTKATGSMKHVPVKQETAKKVSTETLTVRGYMHKLFKEDDQKALKSMTHNPAKFTDKTGVRREKGDEIHDLKDPLKKNREGGGKEGPEFQGHEEKGKAVATQSGRHEIGKKEELKNE